MAPHRPDDVLATLWSAHGDAAAPSPGQWRQFLAADDGGPVQMVYLVRFREHATYPADSDEPPRSGREAFFLAGRALAEVIADVGGQPLLGGFVGQAMVDTGDEAWDYVGAARYPSREAFLQLWLDPRTAAAGVHRRAGTRRHRLFVTRPAF